MIGKKMRTHISYLCLKYRDCTEGDMCFATAQVFSLHIPADPSLHPAAYILASINMLPVHSVWGNQEIHWQSFCRPPTVITTDLSKPRGTGHILYSQYRKSDSPKTSDAKAILTALAERKTIFVCRPEQKTLGYFFTLPTW